MQENYIVGIYARLSRDDERAGESVSIENQKEMLSRYVREQGWTLYDYYCDDGVSGTTFDRPGLNRLVQDATDHKINLVLCKDLSRLGRDYIEAGKYTDFVFPSLGCRFIALNDGVDTLRKNNEMLVILKNVMNDLYARDTSSKIKAVKLSTFKSGKYVGCYAPLWCGASSICACRATVSAKLPCSSMRKKSLRQGAFTTWQRDGKTCGARHPSGMM